ncbi:MAG TPA: 16S rRNA (guanine(527)-N(7))-methyltransferase RsmG [Solirubrobacteraceae bacterium]|nr:16S rRNA (guanine(527)-N(7))-methyltransferase RsmG [Solirubrobacteraceae bacterium]
MAELADRYQLPARAPDQLEGLLELVADEPSAITSVRDPADGVDTHVADSLVALDLPVVREARRVADLGSGGGFPGLVLAIALPDARIALVESVSRKCAFLRGAVAELGIGNADVIPARAEAWPEGLEAHDLVTARALASFPVLVEYAAPLLEVGGHLVAWKGQPEPSEDADGRAAAATLGMSAPESVEVKPFARAISRRLYVSSKVMSTPAGYPRRPGIARKRPLRASG